MQVRRSFGNTRADSVRPPSFPRRAMAEPVTPHVGFAVLALSGTSLGRVDAVEDWRFRLASPAGSMWIRNDAIYRVEPHQVMLICEAAGVIRYKAQ